VRWLSAIAGCDSTKCATASGPKGPTVAVGGVVGVEGGAEVELETNPDQIIDRGIMAGAAEVEPVRDIALLLVPVRLQRGAGHLPVTALLVALVPAVQVAHVR